MSRVLSILEAVADVALWLLARLDESRAAEFRRRLASDPAGVLLEKLNPGADSSATVASSQKCPDCPLGRGARTVDQ